MLNLDTGGLRLPPKSSRLHFCVRWLQNSDGVSAHERCECAPETQILVVFTAARVVTAALADSSESRHGPPPPPPPAATRHHPFAYVCVRAPSVCALCPFSNATKGQKAIHQSGAAPHPQHFPYTHQRRCPSPTVLKSNSSG